MVGSQGPAKTQPRQNSQRNSEFKDQRCQRRLTLRPELAIAEIPMAGLRADALQGDRQNPPAAADDFLLDCDSQQIAEEFEALLAPLSPKSNRKRKRVETSRTKKKNAGAGAGTGAGGGGVTKPIKPMIFRARRYLDIGAGRQLIEP